MREREIRPSDAALQLERAEALVTTDPAAALPLVQKALRSCRGAGGVRCLESRAFSLLGWILAMLGRLDRSEAAFKVAYAPDCPCCRPFIDRRFAYLLAEKGHHAQAVDRAIRAASSAEGSLKGLAVLTLGQRRFYAGDVAGAIHECNEAIRMIPVTSPHHSAALAALGYCLAHSDRPEDVRESFERLPELEVRFKGIKRKSQERAKLAWMAGGIRARYAVFFELKGWERRSTLAKACHDLKTSVEGLDRLGLAAARARIDAAGARTDLGVVEALRDPLKVADVLDGIGADLGLPAQAALDAARVIFTPQRIRLLWAALRELRRATVEAGCDPPLVPYPSGPNGCD